MRFVCLLRGTASDILCDGDLEKRFKVRLCLFTVCDKMNISPLDARLLGKGYQVSNIDLGFLCTLIWLFFRGMSSWSVPR